ncbi:MAG TPA: hypothetical protein VL832_28445 [Puia sp.]|nr:hypothetical protein [Puia sp.]
MKHNIIYLYILAALAASASCKKSNSNPELRHSHPAIASIVGKWSLTKDSSFSAIGVGNFGTVQEYIGQPDDYWDFRSDDKVYIKEGAKLDTLGYKLVTGNTITINTFGWTLNGAATTSTIQPLTFASAVIHSANLLLPAGVYNRTLFLTK